MNRVRHNSRNAKAKIISRGRNMSLRTRIFSIFTIIAGVMIFSIAGFAQDDKSTTTDKTDKNGTRTERNFRGEGRKFDGEGFRHGGRHGFGGPGGMMHMLHGIDLTDDQKTQIHNILEANKPSRENMEAMRTIMMAKRDGTITADQEAQLKAFREEARTKARSVHEQILAILTPEQKQQIETRKQEMKQRMEQRRQEWQQRKQKPAETTEKPNN